MGHGHWSNVDYATYSSTVRSAPRHELYSRTHAAAPTASKQEVRAEKITYRESRDSVDHPLSTPVLVALDVTGSMGIIPEQLTKGGLGRFVEGLLQQKPVTDPHILFMGIGDAVIGDSSPLQATQFESDNRICVQLTDLFLEGGGGGNCYESYDLAWAFAAYRTHTDAWDKRQVKGFLFTVGDEEFPRETSLHYLRTVFGNDCPQAPSPASLLQAAQERYHVFHVMIGGGDYARRSPDAVRNSWGQHLGDHALWLSDHEYLPELLVSAIAVANGEDKEEVLSRLDQKVSKVIREA